MKAIIIAICVVGCSKAKDSGTAAGESAGGVVAKLRAIKHPGQGNMKPPPETCETLLPESVRGGAEVHGGEAPGDVACFLVRDGRATLPSVTVSCGARFDTHTLKDFQAKRSSDATDLADIPNATLETLDPTSARVRFFVPAGCVAEVDAAPDRVVEIARAVAKTL